ncbi:MAG: YbaK/EbsC family protein [Pseudomonadota bacterium]
MSKSLKRVKAAAVDLRLPLQVVETGADTHTAAQAANEVGSHLDQIAKSIVFLGKTSNRALLFLTAGGNRGSAERAAHMAEEPLAKADAALIRAQTGFAIGGVSPIGHLSPIRAFMDPRLLDFDLIWAAAGTPRHLFAIAPSDLLRVTNAKTGLFTE